jgi:hypothetical protein
MSCRRWVSLFMRKGQASEVGTNGSDAMGAIIAKETLPHLS